jgi:hypothetical protein
LWWIFFGGHHGTSQDAERKDDDVFGLGDMGEKKASPHQKQQQAHKDVAARSVELIEHDYAAAAKYFGRLDSLRRRAIAAYSELSSQATNWRPCFSATTPTVPQILSRSEHLKEHRSEHEDVRLLSQKLSALARPKTNS